MEKIHRKAEKMAKNGEKTSSSIYIVQGSRIIFPSFSVSREIVSLRQQFHDNVSVWNEMESFH